MLLGIVGSCGDAGQNKQMARMAEDHGWDGFFTWDAISLGAMQIWDPWSILAAAAVVTERITLGALVFAVPRRRPWELARQALTVDHLSEGRLVLPVGLGVLDDRAFTGVPGQLTGLRERAELLDDTLGFVQQSWSGEPFTFDGTRIHTTDMQFLPRPVRGHIPVWPVASWPSAKSMGRAVKWDGVVPQLRGERAMDSLLPDDVAALAAWVQSHRGQVPDKSGHPFDIVLQGALPTDRGKARELVAALGEAGATWFIEARWDASTTAESLFDIIRQGPPRASAYAHVPQ